MIKDIQEYLQHWEKENNPFYPSEMRWDRLQVNRFLKDYKKQLTLTDVGCSLCIDDDSADILVEKIYKENKEDLQYLTDKEGIFKAGLAHGLLSKIRLHE